MHNSVYFTFKVENTDSKGIRALSGFVSRPGKVGLSGKITQVVFIYYMVCKPNNLAANSGK
jgi:hypothetical protein